MHLSVALNKVACVLLLNLIKKTMRSFPSPYKIKAKPIFRCGEECGSFDKIGTDLDKGALLCYNKNKNGSAVLVGSLILNG